MNLVITRGSLVPQTVSLRNAQSNRLSYIGVLLLSLTMEKTLFATFFTLILFPRPDCQASFKVTCNAAFDSTRVALQKGFVVIH